MTNPVARVSVLLHDGKPFLKHVLTFCPGCRMSHPFTVEVLQPKEKRKDGSDYPVWSWNKNLEKPTFMPSMLCRSSVHLCEDEHPPKPCKTPNTCGQHSHLILNGGQYAHTTPHTREQPWGNCHSYVSDGVWDFLPDSAHRLAGQKVPMVPLPDWMMPRGDRRTDR